MYRSTGIGPSRRMRPRKTSSSAASPSSARALDIDRRRSAPAGPADHPNADQHHRQGIENARGEGTDGEEMSGVRLAEELAERARHAVADQKGAGDHAGPPQRQLRMREPPQHGKEDEAFQRRL